MKVPAVRIYKRKLSKASIEAMSAGGKRGSLEDKRRAGKLGWQAMVRKFAEVTR